MAQIELDELLKSIKEENSLNHEMFNKTLSDINSRLEDIADDGIETELVKNGLQNLKTELDARHRFMVQKFENIKEAFENLNEKQDLFTTNSDMKIMFNILNENIDHFAQEINEQKDLITGVEQKLADFRGDNSKKDEIIENVSVVKNGIDEVNRGLQASIMEVNSSLRGITKSLMTMDVTEQNDIIKRELENIYLAVNANLSSMEILDQKNDELAKNIIAKDDLISLSGRIDNSLAVMSERLETFGDGEKILSEIEKNREELVNFNSNIAKGLTQYLDAVREEDRNTISSAIGASLDEVAEKVAKADNSEKLLSEITANRDELQKINENIVKEIPERINSAFKDGQTEISNSLREMSEKISQSDNSANIISEIGANRQALQKINENLSNSFAEYFDSIKEVLTSSIEGFKIDISSAAFTNGTEVFEKFAILEKISQDIQNFETKNSSHNDEFVVLLNSKIQELSEALGEFKAYMNVGQNSLENHLGERFEELSTLLSQSSSAYEVKVADLSKKIDQSIETIERFSSENDIAIGNSLSEIETIKSEIGRILDNMTAFNSHQEVNHLNLDTKVENDLAELKNNLSGFCSSFETLKYTLEQSNIDNRELLTEIVNEASDKMQSVIAGLSSDNTVEAVKNLDVQIEILRGTLNELNTIFTTTSAQNVAKILASLETTSNKIDVLGVDLSTEIDDNFEMVKDYIESSKLDKKQKSAELAALSERISNLETEISKSSEIFNAAVLEQKESLASYISVISEAKENNPQSSAEFDMLTEKLLSIETAMHDAGDMFGDNLMMVQNKISDYAKTVDEVSRQTDEKLEASVAEISSIKAEFTKVLEKMSGLGSETSEKINETSAELLAKFEDILLNVSDLKQSVDGSVTSSLSKNIEIVEEKFSILQDLLNDNNLRSFDRISEASDNINGRLDALKQEISLVNTDVAEIVASKTAVLADDFAPLKESIDNFLNVDFDKIIDNIKSQIELSYLNFSADVNENLTENHDNYLHLEDAYKALTEKFAKVEGIISDLNENQISVMISTVKEFDNNLTNAYDRTNALIESWKNDLTRLENKLDKKSTENKDELKNCISDLLNKEEFETRVSGLDLELTNIGTELQSIRQDFGKISESSADAVLELKSSIGGLEQTVENFSNAEQSKRIEDLMQALHDKVDVLALSGEDEQVENSLQALHEKIDIIAQSDANDSIEAIEKMLDSLNNKIDLLALSDDGTHVEELIQSLHDKVDILAASDNEENIEEMVQALHEKVDILATSDDSELYTEIQDIKNLIFEQRKKIEEFGKSERNEEVDKRLEKLLSDISTLDFEKNASDIKDSVMNALISVADQITFAEETEEIKDFVEERTDEINKNLLDVKKQLNNIASSSEAWDYSYTMQDIESDIAKLRLILNDISAATSKEDINEISQNMHKIAASVNSLHSSLTEEQILELKSDIEKINSDVMSLSSRTNKLLLTSDESYKALTDGLNDFSRVANQLEKRLDILDNSSLNEVIDKKLDNIQDAVTSSSNSYGIIREVMMYLGEWIDDASEKITSTASDASNIPLIYSEAGLLKSKLEDNLSIVEKRFKEQQNKIELLEQKLDNVLSAVENSPLDAKLDAFEEKMQKLDEKLNKLSKGIEKLASYVD